jgi:hypothetical protein
MRFLAIPFVLICLAEGDASSQEIHLKSRTFSVGPAATVANGTRAARRIPVASHRMVQFDHLPSVDDLSALMEGGQTVVAMVPDDAVMVYGPPLYGYATAELEPGDKISLEYAGMVAQGEGPVEALVEFHGDVPRSQQDLVARAEGLTFVRPDVLRPEHILVSLSAGQMELLAARDEVAYILPADSGLAGGADLMACAGMLTQSGPIGQYSGAVHGWSLDADHTAHLNYFFGALTSHVPDSTVKGEILRAFGEWAKHANVSFQAGASGAAAHTVAVEFVSGAHGDSYPFSPSSATLAHTFYPAPMNAENIAGDMHLNLDENWQTGSDIDIYSVALHEAGHALGLVHTNNPGDVMYPYYRRGVQLSMNDIAALQALYGVPASVAAPITNAPVTTPLPAIRLTLDTPPPPSMNPQATLSGMLSGGAGAPALQWQTDHGTSGAVAMKSSGAWTVSIPLVTGANNITFTAFDSTSQSVSQTVQAIRLLSTPTTSSPVSISVTSPAGVVTTASTPTITFAGKASGGAGIVQVRWQTSAGSSGTATGTTAWLATGVPILTGTNTVIIRAYDAKGATAWTNVVVIRH